MVSHAGIAQRSRAARRPRPAPGVLLAAGDALACLVGFGAATAAFLAAIQAMGVAPPDLDELLVRRSAHFAVFVPPILLWFASRGHYRRGLPFWTEAQQIGLAVTAAALLDGFSQYASHTLYSRPWLIAGWAASGAFLLAGRVGLKHAMLRAGVWAMPTVIVGTGRTAREAAAALNSERLLGYRVVGHVEVPAEGPPPRADDLVVGREPRFVVLALDAVELARAEPLIGELHRRGVSFAVVPPLTGLSVLNLHARGFFSHDTVLLTAPNNLARLHARLLKRGFDVAASAALLVALAPLFAVLALLVRRDGGPVLYGQRRIGRGGRPIVCLKFRTMVVDADAVLAEVLARDPAAREEWEKDHKLKDDPRVTRVGRVLRATSLDELPQLWNVLRGEMSLVGPRPIVAAEVPKFGDDIAFYYEVDPGITGLWQVSGRNELDYDRRVRLNTWYVRNWSLWHDVAILVKTVRVVLARDGAY
jgi:undecaprenyl-phosphate galactose phosphotransferase